MKRKLLYKLTISLTLFLSCDVYSTRAQVAIRVPDEQIDVQDIKEIKGKIWLATTHGLLRVDEDKLTRMIQDDMIVYEIEDVGGLVWLRTNRGAYRESGDGFVLITEQDQALVNENGIKFLRSEFWILTSSGAYMIKGDEPVQRYGRNLIVVSAELINNDVWLATNRGAMRISADGSQEAMLTEASIDEIVSIKGEVWLATSKGAFRIEDGRPKPAFSQSVNKVLQIGPDIWLSTASGVYRQVNGIFQPVNSTLQINAVSNLEGGIWLATNRGAFRVREGSLLRVSDLDVSINSIEQIDNQIWLATNNGAYQYNGSSFQRTPNEDLPILSINKVGKSLWLRTLSGAYLIEDDTSRRIPNTDLIINRIVELGGTVWLATHKGAYRLDQDVVIDVNIKSDDSLWKTLITAVLRESAWVEGVVRPEIRYRQKSTNIDPYSKTFPRSFEVILVHDEPSLNSDIQNNRYAPADTFQRSLTIGRHTMYISVRDQWGNTFRHSVEGFVLPGTFTMGIMVAVVWFLILAGVIALAPISEFCNDLLMNPWLRNFGSFGLIPLAVSIAPPVRTHILRRYLHNLALDKDFAQWKERYEIPSDQFLPDQFGKLLQENRVLHLVGQSGIGKTAYLRFLTMIYTLRQRKTRGNNDKSNANKIDRTNLHELLPQKVVPVFIPIARYQGKKPEDMVSAQLSIYGRLTDKQISGWFIQQGGFLIFFDGLNEVDEDTRNSINHFLDEGRQANYLCISSQEGYLPFTWIKQIRLSPLEPITIKQILVKRLGEKKASQILAQFSADTYRLYMIPQDLESLLYLISEGRLSTVPQEKSTLYEEVLAPIFNIWSQVDRNDYREKLFRRAYEMLVEDDYVLGKHDSPLPNDFILPLAESKVILDRDGYFNFTHNLLRDYLASRYFVIKWRGLLSDKALKIGSNWGEMLKFALVALGESEQRRDLMYALLSNNRRVTRDLFTWFVASKPELLDTWVQDFKLKYADAALAPETN